MDKIALVTSRYWEGAYVLKEFIRQQTPIKDVFIQKTWWRDNQNSFDYSDRYMDHYRRDASCPNQRYFLLEELAYSHDITIHYIESINKSVELLKRINPDIIAVVGSKIINENIISKFDNRILNFHTGVLPFFRGPYSEFWAFYTNRKDQIGTTIHLVDKGIDTGDILDIKRIPVSDEMTPTEAHIKNAISGAELYPRVVMAYLKGELLPEKQNHNYAQYYSSPTNKQIGYLELRLKKTIDLYFAD